MKNFKIYFFLSITILLFAFKTYAQSPVTAGGFGNACLTTGDVTWTNPGTVNTLLVFAKANSAITVGTPAANISTYTTASLNFSSPGTAYENDASAFLVYKNTSGTSVSLTGLTAGVTYHFLIYNANGTSYSTSATASGTTLTTIGNAGSFAAGTITSNSVDLSWIDPTTCFDQVLIVGKQGSAITGNPTGGAGAYPTVGTDFSTAVASDFDGAAKVLYKGTNGTPTITNLTGGTTYFFKIFTRKTSTWSSGAGISFTTLNDPVTAGSFTATCLDAGTAIWTNPSTVGTILVFVKAGSAITTGTPAANISTYTTASTNFSSPGTAYENDPAAFLVFKATTGNTVNLIGLSAGTTYHFLVYNATGTTYSISHIFNNSTLTTPPNATGFSTTPGSNSLALNWTNPVSCIDEVLVVGRSGSAVTAMPTGNGSAYTGSQTFGSGTDLGSSQFAIYKGSGNTETINAGLTNGTTYHFTVFVRRGTTWSTGASVTGVPIDTTPPTISIVDPVDNATGIATDVTLTITFSENVALSAAATSTANDTKILIKRGATTELTIDRSALVISGTTATINLPADLTQINTVYNVLIGNKVITDIAGNAFVGISNNTDWDFTTSQGVTITPGTATANTSTFTTLSNISLTEEGKNDFAAGTNKTLKFAFNGSGYIFDATAIPTLSFGSNNITTATVTSIDFTSVTITYTVSGTNKFDILTISGLKVKTSNVANPPVNIIRVAGSADGMMTNVTVGSSILGTVSSCSAAAPVLSADASLCLNDPLAGHSVAASGTGTIHWFNNAGLTSEITGPFVSATNPTFTELGFSNTPAGPQTRYSTLVSGGCQSSAATFTLTINPLPVAYAGADPAAICPGSPVTLGGNPTLVTPTTLPPYTYTWTEPSGFISGFITSDSPNPTIPGSSITNSTTSPKNYIFRLVIKDANLCPSAPDDITVTVKNIDETVKITSPGTTSFTIYDSPQILTGSPVGGTFSGTGVVLTPGGYQFSPALAGQGSYIINYTTTLSNGCQKIQPFNFDVTNYDPYPSLGSNYCNNEGSINLQLGDAFFQSLMSYVDTWNNIYVPMYGYSPVKFTGLIRNQNESPAPYGYGANGSITDAGYNYTKTQTSTSIPFSLRAYNFNTNALATGAAYPSCPTCNSAYITVYIEFVDPLATAPYNMAAGTDFGYRFRNATTAGFSYSGEFPTVNPVPKVQFSGLTSGLVQPDQFCNANVDYILTGNIPFAGNFKMSYDGTTFNTLPGLTNGSPGLGKATFNPSLAYPGAPSSGVKPIWIQYSYDPGTTGSGSPTPQSCAGIVVQKIYINPLPSIAFSIAPNNDDRFCHDGAAIDLQTNQITSVTLTGQGVSDQGSGKGTFSPLAAYTLREQELNIVPLTSSEKFKIVGTFTDNLGCKSSDSRDVYVQPIPTASFTYGSTVNFCYQDSSTPPPFFDGQEANGRYTLQFGGTVPDINIANEDYTFDFTALFDYAVANGANPLSTVNVTVIYTANDPVKPSCINTQTRLFKIAPNLPVTIAGIENYSTKTYCANEGPFTLTLTPANGILAISSDGGVNYGPAETLTSSGSKFIFNRPDGGNFKLRYEVTTGVNCSNTDIKDVRLLPSPNAIFAIPPQCDGANINFVSQDNTNAAIYQWSFGDSSPNGTNATEQHQYPAPSLYNVRLKIDATPQFGITCTSTATQDVTVGTNPIGSFDITKVCTGDLTDFKAKSSNVGLSTVGWDFGDGDLLSITPSNFSASPIPPGTHGGKTTGTYGNPIHVYAGEGTYSVVMDGKTPPAQGACLTTVPKSISILRKIVPTVVAPYDMTNLNNGDGFWKTEDVNTNSTWAFALPTGKAVITSATPTWITNPSGNYNPLDVSYVNSPCFDLTDFTRPTISLDYWVDADTRKDGAVLQYSVNGGQLWTIIGDLTSGLNWYNVPFISSTPGNEAQLGWSDATAGWLTGKNSINGLTVPNVRFRIAFSSDERIESDGFAFNNVKIEERNRFILLENFTNEKATKVSTNNTGFVNFNSSEIIKIQYDAGFPGADAINALNPSDHNARAAFYGLTNSSSIVPQGYIDGKSGGDFTSNWYASASQLRSLESSPMTIGIEDSLLTSNTLGVRVTIRPLETIRRKKLAAFVAVIETETGNYNSVMRKMLPSAAGTALDTLLTKDKEVPLPLMKWEITAGIDPSKLSIVAFVQDMEVSTEGRKEVLQSAQYTPLASRLPVLVTGLETPLLSGISAYPNPSDQEFIVQLPALAKQSVSVQLADQLGKIVYRSSLQTGEQTKTISTSELAEGLYILQIEADGKVGRTKVIVTHKQ